MAPTHLVGDLDRNCQSENSPKCNRTVIRLLQSPVRVRSRIGSGAVRQPDEAGAKGNREAPASEAVVLIMRRNDSDPEQTFHGDAVRSASCRRRAVVARRLDELAVASSEPRSAEERFERAERLVLHALRVWEFRNRNSRLGDY